MRALEAAMRDIIRRSVMGELTLWPIDHKYPARGSLEERFKRGDRQILLWAIEDCARKKLPIPDWAANALKDIIYGAVQGDFVSWDEAFGKLFVDIQRRRARSLALMLKVWARIHQRNQAGEPKLEELFTSVGEEFDIGATSVKELIWKNSRRHKRWRMGP